MIWLTFDQFTHGVGIQSSRRIFGWHRQCVRCLRSEYINGFGREKGKDYHFIRSNNVFLLQAFPCAFGAKGTKKIIQYQDFDSILLQAFRRHIDLGRYLSKRCTAEKKLIERNDRI